MGTRKTEDNQHEKAPYAAPTISVWGSVADLTKTGQTMPGGDMKMGSVLSPGQ